MSTESLFKSNGTPDVYHGPMSSEFRREGIDPNHPRNLLTDRGLDVRNKIHQDYQRRGRIGIGVAGTFGATNLRGDGIEWNFDPEASYEIDTQWADVNKQAVEIAQSVFGERFLACVAPLPNTDGTDWNKFEKLGNNKRDWARARHRPQLQILRESGTNHVIIEATNYLEEALAIADLVREFRFQTLVVALTLNSGEQFPDPSNPNLRQRELVEKLQEAADVESCHAGLNCIGAHQVTEHWQKYPENTWNIAYLNHGNWGSPNAKKVPRHEFEELAQNPTRTPDQEKRWQEYQTALHTDGRVFAEVFAQALRQKIPVIGGCCGTDWRHANLAKAVIDAGGDVNNSNVQEAIRLVDMTREEADA